MTWSRMAPPVMRRGPDRLVATSPPRSPAPPRRTGQTRSGGSAMTCWPARPAPPRSPAAACRPRPRRSAPAALYRVMPEDSRVDSVRAACTGRSRARLVPLPSIASGSPAAAAAAMAAATAGSVAGASTSAHAACGKAGLPASGKTLAGFSSQSGSKAPLSAASGRARRGELHRHQVPLLDADAVLAGQAAADLDAELQDVGAERLRLVEAAGIVGVEHDQWVQVAVAGMEDIGDLQPVFRASSRRCAPARCGSSLVGMVPSMQR